MDSYMVRLVYGVGDVEGSIRWLFIFCLLFRALGEGISGRFSIDR